MHPLHLKLLRDLTKMKGQVIAVSIVMACGLAMMIMARSLVFSLESTRDAYYQSNRFADVFCDTKRAPNSLRPRLAEIAGVAAVETRVTGHLTLDLPGVSEPADGAILSLPDDGIQLLNIIYLRRGRLPSATGRGEVVIGEAFAEAQHFELGNQIAATIHGAHQILTIVGIGLSPEYVFEARAGETLPDNKRFGVFWMNERELSYAFGLKGAFNNVLIALAPGASEAEVMAQVDRDLAPYGGQTAYGRRDQPSATRLNDEMNVLRGLSFAFPVVFLSIAAFMTSAVLLRVVRLQREQIAQLKAFGYSSFQVGLHYMQFAFFIVGIGIVLGSIAGVWLGDNVVWVYHRFFRFPSLTFHLDVSALAVALLASSGSAFLGVFSAVRQAVKLPPAEAMRPEPPAEYHASILERIGLTKLFGASMRMALRNLERSPWQSFFTAFGLALATGIPIVPGAMRDGINYLLEFQWDQAARQDATVALIEAGSSSTVDAIRHLPGVTDVQPFRVVSANLRFGHHTRRIGVSGVTRDAIMSRLLNADATPMALPPNGLLLSAKLAEVLGAKPGDTITLEIQEGRRPKLDAVVQGLVTDYAGVSAYMDIDALRRLMQEGQTVNGAHVAVDTAYWTDFLQKVSGSPRIASLAIKNSTRQSFRKSTGDMIGLVQTLYFTFAVIISFGVVYNSARIALSERGRDLATLRVVGFTHGEVAAVMIGELSVLTLLAIPIGLGIGSLLAYGVIHSVSTESVRLPLVLSSRSYATAVLIVSVSVCFSFWVVSRRIRDLDLLSVLKARD